MKISHRSPVALAVALALAAQGVAVTANAAVDGALEEIVVTATKREQKLKEIPMGISAVTGDDLVRRNETGFVDFAAQVPGLSLQASNPGQIRLVLRGANVGSVGATVATVIDDIPFSMTGAQTNGAVFGANVDTYDMQRIEVLRGPQGTLYGATAEGGLIRYVTNAPNLDGFEADVGAGGESVSGGDSAARLRGMVNIPLVDGKLAFRASAVQDDRPGWIDNTELGRDDWNDVEKYSVRASLLWKPSDNLTARLSFFRQNLVANGRNDIRVVGAALTPQDPPANKFDAVDGMSNQTGLPAQVENDLTVYAASLEYDFDSFSLMSSTSYGEFDLPYVNDVTYANVAPGLSYGDFFGAFVYGEPTQIVINQTDFLHKFNQELRIASKPGSTLGSRGLDWQAGVFFTHEVTMLDQPVSALSAATGDVLSPPIGGAIIPSGLKELSGYADFTYYLTDQFDLSFGVRHSKTEQYSQVRTQCCIIFGPGEDFETLRSDENKTTYSLAPRFRFDADTMVYARFATGYRAGGPNLPTPTLPNPPLLKPDSTQNYELGFRTELLDGKFSVDLTIFQIDWEDAQVLSIVQTETGPVGINGNAGEARSRGIEWNLQYRPLDNLTFGLVGAYTDAQLTSDAPGLGASSGEELPFVPDLQTTLNVDWAFGRFGGYTATAGASYTHVGEQYTNFSPSAAIESHVKLPDYQTLKMQIGIDNGKFSLQVYANNLTDEDAYVGYFNSGGAGQTGLATVIQPRTVGVFAGYRF